MAYLLLLTPVVAGGLAQVLKILWHLHRGTLDWSVLNMYGGMPSAHTAMTVSLTTAIGLEEGITTASFAIAALFTIIVIRDAIGFRRYLGAHSRALNLMVRELPDEEQWQFAHFRERLGHTPFEALAGGTLGVGVAVLVRTLLIA